MIKEKVQTQFDIWNEALQTGNPDNVLKCYSSEAVLLPTLSNTICNTPEKIKTYFQSFLQKKPFGKINECHERVINNIATLSGIYTFTFGDQSSAQARFSFVYKKINEEWKIIEHHSSLMPE